MFTYSSNSIFNFDSSFYSSVKEVQKKSSGKEVQKKNRIK